MTRTLCYNYNTMVLIWDYDIKELKKTEQGRLKILERLINYGIFRGDREKIDLSQVKKYWDKLTIDPDRRRLLKYLVWGR